MAFLKTVFLCVAIVSLLFGCSESTEFLVGGSENAWRIPTVSDSLSKWAQELRFKIGDFLVWKYDGAVDSVLEVTKEDYESCTKTKPIQEYKDGNTKIELKQSGPIYFISGADGHCEKGQKLEVIVLSSAHVPPVASPAPAPGSPGSSVAGDAPAPAKGDGCGLKAGVFGALLGFGSLVLFAKM